MRSAAVRRSRLFSSEAAISACRRGSRKNSRQPMSTARRLSPLFTSAVA
jgi:hypothetical protein